MARIVAYRHGTFDNSASYATAPAGEVRALPDRRAAAPQASCSLSPKPGLERFKE